MKQKYRILSYLENNTRYYRIWLSDEKKSTIISEGYTDVQEAMKFIPR